MVVSEIRVYPVKAMQGLSLPCAEVEPWGLAGDRRWMVVDDRNRFLTQRDVPRLAVVDATPDGRALVLAAEGFGSTDVPAPDGRAGHVDVSIFKDVVRASEPEIPEANAWLSKVLGLPCRLVFMADPAGARPVDPGYALPSDRVSFADGFPVLVTSNASLADLNTRLDRPVSMDRFRTNIAVDGSRAWAEDGWRRIRIGSVTFAAPKNCARCAVPTVDQMSGERSADNEPIRSLSAFRRDDRGRIIFGQNLIPSTLGRVSVGDPVLVEG